MKEQYHILNDDSLIKQFPETIYGEIIVARECLADGKVNADSLKDLLRHNNLKMFELTQHFD